MLRVAVDVQEPGSLALPPLSSRLVILPLHGRAPGYLGTLEANFGLIKIFVHEGTGCALGQPGALKLAVAVRGFFAAFGLHLGADLLPIPLPSLVWPHKLCTACPMLTLALT